MTPLEVSVPVKTETQLRGRTWRANWGRAKSQRAATAGHLLVRLGWRNRADLALALQHGQRLAITLTRVHPTGAVKTQWKPADDDNLRKACKHVRDEVARWLEVDDADPRIEWRYEQAEGEWAVNVRIESAKEGE